VVVDLPDTAGSTEVLVYFDVDPEAGAELESDEASTVEVGEGLLG
jgi:hypothetical protein